MGGLGSGDSRSSGDTLLGEVLRCLFDRLDTLSIPSGLSCLLRLRLWCRLPLPFSCSYFEYLSYLCFFDLCLVLRKGEGDLEQLLLRVHDLDLGVSDSGVLEWDLEVEWEWDSESTELEERDGLRECLFFFFELHA